MCLLSPGANNIWGPLRAASVLHVCGERFATFFVSSFLLWTVVSGFLLSSSTIAMLFTAIGKSWRIPSIQALVVAVFCWSSVCVTGKILVAVAALSFWAPAMLLKKRASASFPWPISLKSFSRFIGFFFFQF